MVLIHLQLSLRVFQSLFMIPASSSLSLISLQFCVPLLTTHEVHVIWAFLLALIIPIYLKTVKDSNDHHPEKGFNPNLAN